MYDSNEDELTREERIQDIAQQLEENKIIMLKISDPEFLKAELERNHNLKVYFRPATIENPEEETREPVEGIYNFIVEGYEFDDDIPVTWDEPEENFSEDKNHAPTHFSNN